jgi:hypothetical protein
MPGCTPFHEDGGAQDSDATDVTLSDVPTLSATVESGSTVDAAGASQGNPPASPRCDITKPFSTPVFVPGLGEPSAVWIGGLRLSPDGLTGYFFMNYGPDGASSSKLYEAARLSEGAPFGNAINLAVDSAYAAVDQFDPTVSGSGLTLVFEYSSSTPTGTLPQLGALTRASTAVPFSAIGWVLGIDGGLEADSPFFREDGAVLYFSSRWNVDGGSSQVFVAPWTQASLGAPIAVDLGSALTDDGDPVVTPDDLTIYFSSNRPDVQAQGGYDVWVATRVTASAPFSSFTNVTELNSSYDDRPTFVSSDGCTLYFMRYFFDDIHPGGVFTQYVADKPPP